MGGGNVYLVPELKFLAMRLLIAGILSLVIYLMTCGYKKEKIIDELRLERKQCETYFNYNRYGLFHFVLFPETFYSFGPYRLYIFKENPDIQIP